MAAELDLEILSNIFGPDALSVTLTESAGTVVGEYNIVNPLPWVGLTQVYTNPPTLDVKIIEEDTVGHFKGPQTLPAYKLVQLAAQLHGCSVDLVSANFEKIVKPSDIIRISSDGDRINAVRLNTDTPQTVATLKLTPSQINSPKTNKHTSAQLLEIGAQTIVANLLQGQQGEQLYPLITGIWNLRLVQAPRSSRVFIYPENCQLKGKKAKGGCTIYGEDWKPIALIANIDFHFATAREVEFYNAWGRNR
jgi:hypothetical protein